MTPSMNLVLEELSTRRLTVISNDMVKTID